MEWYARGTQDGRMEIKGRARDQLKEYLVENVGVKLRITPVLPESPKQRRWFEGALVPLVTYYQEGLDHKSSDDRHRVREWLKIEFNGEFVEVDGQSHRVAKSTKGELRTGLIERVLAWLEENYDPPREALDPDAYKHWRDAVFPHGGPDTYIDYLVETGILTNVD